MILIEGRVAIHPTEDPDRVRSSVLNIFPDSSIREIDDHLLFTSKEIDTFAEIIRDHSIRDTASMVLERARIEDATSFYLNKQAAFMGVVNFTEGESTLGDIEVQVKEGAREFIESIRPGLI